MNACHRDLLVYICLTARIGVVWGQMLAYLNSYADHYKIKEAVQLNTAVKLVSVMLFLHLLYWMGETVGSIESETTR